MPSIPIVLVPQNYPYTFEGAGINDLLTTICGYITAAINVANVSFFVQGTVDPGSDQGLFYNQTQGIFKVWNSGTANYIPTGITVQPGDTKVTFIDGDEPLQGWIKLDGRLLSSITGISQTQFNVLQILFGTSPTAALPNWTVIGAFAGLPAAGSFSTISIPAVSPPTGQFGNLAFSNPPQTSEVQALAANAETLDDSTQQIQGAMLAMQSAAEAMLDALLQSNSNGAAVPAFNKIFVGFPS